MTAYNTITDAFDDVIQELDNLIDRMLRNTSELYLVHTPWASTKARPFEVVDAQNGDELVADFATPEAAVNFMFAHRRLHGSTIDMNSIREHCPEADALCVAEEKRLAEAFEVLNHGGH